MIRIINDYVFKYMYVYFLAFGLLLLLLSFSLKGKKNRRIYRRDKKDILISIVTFPITGLAKLISPKSEEGKEKARKTFSRLRLNIVPERFYVIKILIPILTLLIIALIHYTNVQYEVSELLNTPMTKEIDITVGAIVNDSEEILEDLDYYQIYNTIVNEYKDYKNVEDLLISGELDSKSRDVILRDISSVVQDNYELDAKISKVVAGHIINHISKIINIKKFKTEYFIIAFATFFLPDFVILILNAYNRQRYKNDIEILKITTLVLGSMDDMTVKKLLESLKKVSSAYNPIINEALNNYHSIQDGKSDAIMNMANEVKLPQFRKLCGILKEISSGNKTTALVNLEADMILEDKESEMVSNDKIEKKSWVAILLIAPSMLLLMMLLLMPFAKYYQNMNF